MESLVRRLATQAIENGHLDHWNFNGLHEQMVPAHLVFGVRFADSDVRTAVEKIVKPLPGSAVRSMRGKVRTEIACPYRMRSISFADHPYEAATAAVTNCIWQIVRVYAPGQ